MAREQQATWRDLEAEQVRNEARRASRGGPRDRDAAGRHHAGGAREHPPHGGDEDPDGRPERGPGGARRERSRHRRGADRVRVLAASALRLQAPCARDGEPPGLDARARPRGLPAPGERPRVPAGRGQALPVRAHRERRLRERYERGEWVPYTEEELVGVLTDDVLATPAFCPRVAHDPRFLDPATSWRATRSQPAAARGGAAARAVRGDGRAGAGDPLPRDRDERGRHGRAAPGRGGVRDARHERALPAVGDAGGAHRRLPAPLAPGMSKNPWGYVTWGGRLRPARR